MEQKQLFNSAYTPKDGVYDEFVSKEMKVRQHYDALSEQFSQYTTQDYCKFNEEAKIVFFNEGITFAVYSDNPLGSEKIFPFDFIPRIIAHDEWTKIEKGILQRNHAINEFLKDLYHDKKILKDGVVPKELIYSSANMLSVMEGFNPLGGIYNHISGTDLIRHSDGEYYVLEDNVRCPSGVSYVLANRNTLKKTFPKLFSKCQPQPIIDYPEKLLTMLQSVSPGNSAPNCVVLSPGMYNSAYFEHCFLAQSMGVELVEGRDLFVKSDVVYMKTIHGSRRVHVIYRRIDDPFLDPLLFNPDSVLGTPGLMSAYLAGNVTLVNAPGTGVADDKAVYAYMPEIIKYYLGEEQIIKNVPTYRCGIDSDLKYVLENVDKLVIKPVDESGGYGISIGNTLTKEQINEVKLQIQQNRRKYIAQPIMSLSVHPTFIEGENIIESRHIDLRTFCLLGKNIEYVLPGGLTRVALKRGNLIVNSSQGGGSKDTWVI
ncbi:MAG: circularly permuted type 2 ATP-grasp protein [Bacteroidetes bacterium]|nr:circularly permuted type 2 ATP-grasp protein [Bacteroidota bacterium]